MIGQSFSTKRRSIRYQDGVIYSPNWVSVYVPLSDWEAEAFLRKVEQKEASLNRTLTQQELIDLAEGIP